MEKKIQSDFILQQYRSGIESYTNFTKEVGLWVSEQYVFQKYLKTSDTILDLGCGTGRTTFPLFNLGYTQITGVDLTPEMIASAQKLNSHFNTNITFQIGDATQLDFPTAHFDALIFSFNGIMSIPSQTMRDKALQEINRVLKPESNFIFTTHDREKDVNYLKFWEEQAEIWKKGEQRKDLFEFGDIIASSKNESREIYIHIPNQSEIEAWLGQNGFKVLETFYRIDKFEESEAVKVKSGECRFWIAQKSN